MVAKQEPTLNVLFDQLKTFNTPKPSGEETRAIIPTDIPILLSKTLGESVLWLQPESAENPSPLRMDKKAIHVMAYAKRLRGAIIAGESSNDSLLKDRAFDKPLVMLFPIMGLNGTEGDWVCSVALPKDYKAPFGEATGNTEHEVIFYMDSSMTSEPSSMPVHFALFYQLLTQGCSYSITQSKQKIPVTIPAAFPKSAFFNGSHQSRVTGTDSLSWALYNAWMIVLTGHVHFAKTLQPDVEANAELKKILANILVPQEEVRPVEQPVPIAIAPKLTEPLVSVSKEQLVKEFLDAYQLIKPQPIFSELQENMVVTLKHLLLMIERSRYRLTEKPSRQELGRMFKHDQGAKQRIYALPMDDLSPHLVLLDEKPLTQLQQHVANPETLLTQLKGARAAQYKIFKTWEDKALQQRRATAPDLQLYAEDLKNYIVQHSLIGLGSEFFFWLGQLLRMRPDVNQVAGLMKQGLGKTSQSIAFYLTGSNDRALEISEATSAWLTEHNALSLCRWMGFTLGLYYTYSAGLMSLMRLLMVGQLTQLAYHRFSGPIVDDEKALIRQRELPYGMRLSPSAYFRIMMVIFAGIETVYRQDLGPCIGTLGGFGGSLGVTALATSFIPDLRVLPHQKPSEDQLFILLMLTNVGYLLGQTMATFALGTWYVIVEKLRVRQAFMAQFQAREAQGEIGDVRFDAPDLSLPSRRWFSDDNPLNVEWRNPRDGLFYHADCQVRPAPNVEGFVATCEMVEGRGQLSLGSSGTN